MSVVDYVRENPGCRPTELAEVVGGDNADAVDAWLEAESNGEIRSEGPPWRLYPVQP